MGGSISSLNFVAVNEPRTLLRRWQKATLPCAEPTMPPSGNKIVGAVADWPRHDAEATEQPPGKAKMMCYSNGGIGADVGFIALDKNKSRKMLGIKSRFDQ